MGSTTYCTPLPGAWTSNPCVDEKAGLIAVVLIHKSVFPMTDPEDNTEWTTNINAGDAFALYETKGEYPGASFTEEEEGFGRTAGRTTGAAHEFTFEVQGVNITNGGTAVNMDWADKVNKAQGEYYAGFVTGNLDMFLSTQPVRVLMTNTNPQSKKDDQVFTGTVKWEDFSLMSRYDAPAITYEAP